MRRAVTVGGTHRQRNRAVSRVIVSTVEIQPRTGAVAFGARPFFLLTSPK